MKMQIPIVALVFTFCSISLADDQPIQYNALIPHEEHHEHAITRKHSDMIIDSATLRAADGHFVTYDDIGIMLQLREYLRTVLYGTKNADGALSGPYFFDNTPHCLRTLVQMEKNLESATRDAWLAEVRNAFNEHTKDTKKRAEGSKTQQYVYIKRSCELHNRLNSVLLLWAQAPEGQEDDAIDTHVHTFYDMAQFVVDLMNFLDDMVSSCPRAKKQFLDKIPIPAEREKLARLLDHIYEQQMKKITKLRKEPSE